MIRLVMTVGNDQHGASGAHRFACGTDTALMHVHAGARKDGRVRSVGYGDHARAEVPFRPVRRVMADQEHGPAAEPMSCLHALLEEVSSSADRSRTEGED